MVCGSGVEWGTGTTAMYGRDLSFAGMPDRVRGGSPMRAQVPRRAREEDNGTRRGSRVVMDLIGHVGG